MRKSTIPFVGVYALALSSLAFAEWPVDKNLQPLQAHTISLESQTAVVYYLKDADDRFDVVATIASTSEAGGPAVRHRVTLSEGQSYELSIDDAVTGQPVRVNFTAQPKSLRIAAL